MRPIVIPAVRPDWSAGDVLRALAVDHGDQPLLQAQLEEQLGMLTGADHVVATGSGRAALSLGLRSAGAGRGSVVALPGLTCRAVLTPLVEMGAKPLFIDAGPWLGEDLGEAATAATDTAAVVTCGVGGLPSNAAQLATSNRAVTVVDDAAQSLGAMDQDGRPAGRAGRFGVLSFNLGKTLMATGGGALITDDSELAGRARALRRSPGPGRSRRALLAALGRHRWRAVTRLPTVALRRLWAAADSWAVQSGAGLGIAAHDAALVLGQLPRLSQIIEGRRRAGRSLVAALGGLGLDLPPTEGNTFSKFPVLLPTPGAPRDKVARTLWRAGIETEGYYEPLHDGSVRLPRADAIFPRVLVLPVHPALSARQVDRIADALGRSLQAP